MIPYRRGEKKKKEKKFVPLRNTNNVDVQDEKRPFGVVVVVVVESTVDDVVATTIASRTFLNVRRF